MNSESLKLLTFDKSAFGYKVDEVDNCMNEIVKYLNFLEQENNSLKNDIKSLTDKNKELEASQDGVKELLVSAQKFSDNIIKEAKAKSDFIIKEANEKAESMVSEATNNLDNVRKENEIKTARETAQLKAIQKEVSNFKSQLLSSYKAHLDLITKLPSFEDKTQKEELHATKQPDSSQNQTESNKEIKETFDFEQKPKEERKEFPGFTPKEFNKSTSNNKTSSFEITFQDSKGSVNNSDSEKEPVKNNFKSRFGELKFGEN